MVYKLINIKSNVLFKVNFEERQSSCYLTNLWSLTGRPVRELQYTWLYVYEVAVSASVNSKGLSVNVVLYIPFPLAQHQLHLKIHASLCVWGKFETSAKCDAYGKQTHLLHENLYTTHSEACFLLLDHFSTWKIPCNLKNQTEQRVWTVPFG